MEGSAVSEGKCQKTELRGDEGIATGLVGGVGGGGAVCQGHLDDLHFWTLDGLLGKYITWFPLLC